MTTKTAFSCRGVELPEEGSSTVAARIGYVHPRGCASKGQARRHRTGHSLGQARGPRTGAGACPLRSQGQWFGANHKTTSKKVCNPAYAAGWSRLLLALVFDERGEIRHAVIEEPGGLVEILREPVDRGRPPLIGRAVDRFDQGAAHARAA